MDEQAEKIIALEKRVEKLETALLAFLEIEIGSTGEIAQILKNAARDHAALRSRVLTGRMRPMG